MPSNPVIRNISRDRLMAVFRDEDLVRVFEAMLYGVGTTLPEGTQAAQDDAASALQLRPDLANSSLSAKGPGLVAFNASLNYAAGTLGAALGGMVINVTAFPWLAKGDGATDDSAAIQAAINRAQATGTPLFLPAGTYLIGTALNVTGNLTMFGAGRNSSILRTVTDTQNMFVVNTGSGIITMSDLWLIGKATATAGALVSLDGGTFNVFAAFDRVRFQDGFNQLYTIAAGSWTANDCHFVSPNNTGCTIQNILNLDGGDMGIMNCTFLGKDVGVAVLQLSAGGLRFIGNKVIAWADGYKLDMVSGTSTADLFILGNSFERFTGTAIALLKDAGNSFVAAHISDNEIAGAPNGIIVNGTGTWLTHLTITGNDALVNSNGVCISIAGANSFNVGFNKLDSGGGTSIGLALAASNSNGVIHDNRFHTLGTTISGVGTGTNIVIHDNSGYNPVGASALTPAASPWTLTNGPTRASVCMAAATGITNITINGVQYLVTGVGANINFTLDLGPNEVAVITYVGTLTAKQMVH